MWIISLNGEVLGYTTLNSLARWAEAEGCRVVDKFRKRLPELPTDKFAASYL